MVSEMFVAVMEPGIDGSVQLFTTTGTQVPITVVRVEANSSVFTRTQLQKLNLGVKV